MPSLEQLKSEAREKYKTRAGIVSTNLLSSKDLDTLVTTAFNAGLERAVEVVKNKLEEVGASQCGRCGYLCTGKGWFCTKYKNFHAVGEILVTLQAKVNKDKK